MPPSIAAWSPRSLSVLLSSTNSSAWANGWLGFSFPVTNRSRETSQREREHEEREQTRVTDASFHAMPPAVV